MHRNFLKLKLSSLILQKMSRRLPTGECLFFVLAIHPLVALFVHLPLQLDRTALVGPQPFQVHWHGLLQDLPSSMDFYETFFTKSYLFYSYHTLSLLPSHLLWLLPLLPLRLRSLSYPSGPQLPVLAYDSEDPLHFSFKWAKGQYDFYHGLAFHLIFFFNH